jgi:thymidylate kinase
VFSKIILELFSQFNRQNVIYCHWKSTDHLDASFKAETDLDVLVESESFSIIEPILIRSGFIRCRTPDARTYPAVEDYICYDAELAKWIHFHMHYKLPCGDRWVKSYHLPIEKYLLSQRQYIDKYSMYNIDPISEYLMFIYRMHMKWDNPSNKKSMLIENAYLIQYLSEHGFDKLTFENTLTKHPLYESRFHKFIINWYTNQYIKNSFFDVIKFKIFLKKYRRMSEIKYQILRGVRYSYRLNIEIKRRFFKIKSTGRRQLVTGGKLISFVGMDGAGKTSMIDRAFSKYSEQVNVQKIFFGTGRSGAGFLRSLIFKIYGTKANASENKKNNINYKKLFWIFLCLRDRKKELRKLQISLANGCLVLVDRWPQNHIPGLADAPKLSNYINSNGLTGYLAKEEDDFYSSIQSIALNVDKTLIFDIKPETSLLRKPNELRLEQADEYRTIIHTLKNEGVFQNAHIIDAEKSFEIVRAEMLKSIWVVLYGK